jgi:phospholipid/cholesterol/gamma-HCH transport system substrate-binding protein
MKARMAILGMSLVLLVSGCGGFSGLAQAPLPGGPNLGNDPIEVRIEVADALNLVPQASVKVGDVTVGTVRSITRKGWTAEVSVSLRRDVALPANARAAIRQTGLLGEKYVELAAPEDEAPQGTLTSGTVIDIRHSGRSLEVEEVLGSLSLLLNGGGIDRLRTITVELRRAMQGHESDFRDLLDNLDTLTDTLAVNRSTINHALEGLDRLSARTRANDRVIDRALLRVGPAVRVLADQRTQLTAMLRATSRLATAGTRTVVAVHQDLVASLNSLEPILAGLAEAGDDLPKALRYALTFPFPEKAFSALKGDHMNVAVEAEIRETDLMALLGLSGPNVPTVLPGSGQAPAAAPQTPLPSIAPNLAQLGPLLNSVLSSLGLTKTPNN